MSASRPVSQEIRILGEEEEEAIGAGPVTRGKKLSCVVGTCDSSIPWITGLTPSPKLDYLARTEFAFTIMARTSRSPASLRVFLRIWHPC